jgi:hypothetical protein
MDKILPVLSLGGIMSILQLLRYKNPQNYIQAIQFLAKSGSPYAIELLREIAQRAKDPKMREYCQKAASHIKKQLISEHQDAKSKRKRITDNSIHIEILMALAFLSLDDFQSRNAQRAVARAYALDMDLLNNTDYSRVAEQVFTNRIQDIEEEIRDFVKQEVKNNRSLKSSYPFYMYLIDVPVVVAIGGTILAVPNADYIRRFLQWQIENNDFIDWDVLMWIAGAVLLLVTGRVLAIAYEQNQKQKLSGWEKEARHLAISHLEGEIQKLVAASR